MLLPIIAEGSCGGAGRQSAGRRGGRRSMKPGIGCLASRRQSIMPAVQRRTTLGFDSSNGTAKYLT
jgi:hypothetical protein